MTTGNYKCAVCDARHTYSAGQCGICGRVAVIWDGAADAEQAQERERQEQEQRAAEARKQAEQAARGRSRQQEKRVPDALQPKWSTKFAVLAFIAMGITLAAYEQDGTVILIGAAVAAGMAGAFYRQILAVAGIAAVIWIAVTIFSDGERRPAPGGTADASSWGDARPQPPPPSPPPPPPPPWVANQPSKYPNVLTGEQRDTYVPALGYVWVDSNAKTVAWQPGLQHPTEARAIASVREKKWTDRLGYHLEREALAERAKDAARTAEFQPPPNVQGSLFASSRDFDLWCDAFQRCAIYHGPTVSYEALSHLEYHEDQHWVAVVMRDGRRLDLGGPVKGEVRPAWREMVYVEIARTKNGEVMESRRLDQFTLREGSDSANRESYLIGMRGTPTRDLVLNGKLVFGGIAVDEVLPGSPAQRADLRKGDLIFRIDDRPALGLPTLLKTLRDKRGSPVGLHLIRNNQHHSVSVQPVLADQLVFQ